MTLLPSRGSVYAPPLNLDGLVIASTRRWWRWGWDIKGGICLFTQTLTLRTLSHCVRRPTTLSPPHYEKAKPHRGPHAGAPVGRASPSTSESLSHFNKPFFPSPSKHFWGCVTYGYRSLEPVKSVS